MSSDPHLQTADRHTVLSADRLTVLQVARPARGGLRRHLQRLLRGLPDYGVDVCLAAPAEELAAWGLPDGLTEGPIRAVPVPDRPHPLHDPRAARVLRSVLLDLKPDLIHAHGYRAAWIAALARRGNAAPWDAAPSPPSVDPGSDPAPRIIALPAHPFTPFMPLPSTTPLVVTAHNLMPLRPSLAGALGLRLTLREVSRWIAITEAVKRSLEAVGAAPSSIRVIPNGVDPAAFRRGHREEERHALGIPPDAPLVAIIARLEPNKGVDLGLRAFAMLRRGVPAAHLAIIGDGPDRAALESLARELGLRSAVRFTGWRENATALLSVADACLIPSRSEGQSLVALEAMALRVPVVAAAVGGLPEMVRHGETGLLAPAGDVGAMALGLSRLLKEPALRRRVVMTAEREVHLRWSEARMVRRTAELYRAILGRGGR